ncbi:nitrogen regulation protein NR(II) [Pseudaeromonas sharmana]|uniref:histidine kinase n=1 Tax=Pseudaeromonas sharmana TaxID=328412 RepID=A0ABV8CK03_9GAMM
MQTNDQIPSPASRWQEPALLAELFDEIPSGLILLDETGRIARSNRAADTLLGESLQGKLWIGVIHRLFCLRPDDGHEVSLRNGRRVQISTQPLRQQTGQLVQITDLTETRRLQDQLGHLERLSALGKMAASLAHQIRTPLAAAMLYGANLANRTLSQDARSSFQRKLMDRLRDLENQVSDVLLFARNGEQQVVSVIELTALIDSVEAGAEAMIQQHQAQLRIEMDSPPVPLLANSAALASAINNLLANALQAGARSLLLSAHKVDDEAVIRVVDNGCGMASDVVARVFEPFFTTRSRGTGLGLAVVQSVVHSHQGKVEVASVPGEGTCFTIRLPIHQDAAALRQGGVA